MSGWSSPLLAFHDLPAWLRDNEFLLHSHRPALDSYTECGKTLFRLHTETCNIWTHIIGKTPIKNTKYQLTTIQNDTLMLCLIINTATPLPVYCHGFRLPNVYMHYGVPLFIACPTSREGGVFYILRGCNHLPRLILNIPHLHLPFPSSC